MASHRTHPLSAARAVSQPAPRCNDMYLDMNRCHSRAAGDPQSECRAFIEDWVDCMRHRKEADRAQTMRSQPALNLAADGSSKAEVAALLQRGVRPAVNLRETQGYDGYKPAGEQPVPAIRA